MNRERVLVAYGAAGESTAEIAEAIVETLRGRGLDVELQPAAAVDDVLDYDAVILGADAVKGRWDRAAWRFARRFAGDLTMRPVWVFSSGPLDWSADEGVVAPVAGAERAIAHLDARAHMTFGGCETTAPRRPLRRRGQAAGDFRNFERICAWAADVAVELRTPALHLLAI